VRRPLVAALLLGALLAAASVAPGLPPLARAAEFTMSTAATYSVEPDDGRVAVSVRVTFENTSPDPAGEFSVFNVIDLAIQPGASDLGARDGTGALTVTPTARDGYVQASVRPRQGVRYGDEVTFTLRYSIPDGAAGGVRVGQSLVSFAVWGFGTSGRVTVNLPGSYEVSLDGDEMTAERAASGWVLESGAIEEPANWLAQLVAVGEASHQTSTRAVPLRAATVDLQVRAWTDDEAWGERTLELVSAALPLLEDRLGVPYPEVGPLVVEETVAGAQDLGGEPAPSGTHLQVGYDQPGFTLLHQLAHVWLADDLVAQRWITEGFASWMAAGAAAELDVDPPFDPATRRGALSDSAFPLVSWGAGESSPEQDAFAYAASWAVAEEIASLVGDDALRLAWQRMAAGTSPYEPIAEETPTADEPSPNRQPVDARALLDQLEAVGDEELGELFERWVLDEETSGHLADRSEARQAYEGLLTAAGDWGAPEPVKVDLAAWRFESATQRIGEAVDWLADRDELMASAELAGLSVPQRLRDRYRTAGGSDDARDELEAEAAVVVAYQAALDRNAAPRGIVERIGLLGGSDPGDLLADANRLFAEGDLHGAADATAEAGARLERASTEGLLRVAAAAAVVVALLALAVALARRQRRRPAPVGDAPGTDYTAAP
jgi:hypothetical protein